MSNQPSKQETLFVHREWTDEFGLKHHARIGSLRQVVSEYTEQIERLRATLTKIRDTASDIHVRRDAERALIHETGARHE